MHSPGPQVCILCLLRERLFGPEAAMSVFRKALHHVAKSGEVWCEGARLFLNPSSRLFHPQNAAKCLNYALFFTPQYGDTIIEVGLANSCSLVAPSHHAHLQHLSGVPRLRQPSHAGAAAAVERHTVRRVQTLRERGAELRPADVPLQGVLHLAVEGGRAADSERRRLSIARSPCVPPKLL